MDNITLENYIKKVNRQVKPVSELNLNFDRQGFKDDLRQGLGREGGFSQRQAAFGRKLADAINSKSIDVESALQDIIKLLTPRMLSTAEQSLKDKLMAADSGAEDNSFANLEV